MSAVAGKAEPHWLRPLWVCELSICPPSRTGNSGCSHSSWGAHSMDESHQWPWAGQWLVNHFSRWSPSFIKAPIFCILRFLILKIPLKWSREKKKFSFKLWTREPFLWHNFGAIDQVEWNLEKRKNSERNSRLQTHQESQAPEKVKAVWGGGVSTPF